MIIRFFYAAAFAILCIFCACSNNNDTVCDGKAYTIVSNGSIRTAEERQTGISASFDRSTLLLTVFDAGGKAVYSSGPLGDAFISIDESVEDSSLTGEFGYSAGTYYAEEEDKLYDHWELHNGEVRKSTLQTDENAALIDSFVKSVQELLLTEKRICGMAQALDPALFITEERKDILKKSEALYGGFALSDISMACTLTMAETMVSSLDRSMWSVAAAAVFKSSADDIMERLPYLDECLKNCVNAFNSVTVVDPWSNK